MAHAKVCAGAACPMVIGSTGFTPETRAELATQREDHPRGAGAEHLGGRQRRHPGGGRAGAGAGRGLRRGGAGDAPPDEEGRALGHGAEAGGGAGRGAGALEGGSHLRAQGLGGRALRRGRLACRRCGAGTWWASTRCSSSARASASSSPTGRPAGTSSPRERCGRRAGWWTQRPGLYDMADVLGLKRTRHDHHTLLPLPARGPCAPRPRRGHRGGGAQRRALGRRQGDGAAPLAQRPHAAGALRGLQGRLHRAELPQARRGDGQAGAARAAHLHEALHLAQRARARPSAFPRRARRCTTRRSWGC